MSSLKLAHYNLPSGTSIFNRKVQRFRQFRSSLQDRRRIIISTDRLSKSFLERLRLTAYLFSDLLRRSIFGKIDTIRLSPFDSKANIWTIRIVHRDRLLSTFRNISHCTQTKGQRQRQRHFLIDSNDITFLCPILSNLKS